MTERPVDAKVDPIVCASCQKEPKSYFEIRHFRRGAFAPQSVCVCSLICLAKWTYEFGLSKGITGYYGLQQFLTKLSETVKGK